MPQVVMLDQQNDAALESWFDAAMDRIAASLLPRLASA
jgi:hypothetical protein